MPQGLTLEQLKGMGAKPTAAPTGGGLTLEQLKGMGAKPTKSGPTVGGQIVRDIVKAPIKAGLAVARGVATPFSKKVRDEGVSVKSKYLGTVKDPLATIDDKAVELGAKVRSGELSFGEGLARILGASAGEALDIASLAPVGEVGNVGLKTLKGAKVPIKEALKSSFKRSGLFSGAYNAADQLEEGQPFDPLALAGSIAAGTALDVGASKLFPGAVNRAATGPGAEKLESDIVKKFEKGVKPLMQSSLQNTKKYKDEILESVNIIKANKDNLSFTDELGDVVTGKAPKSLQQLVDAIEQTKKSIFSKYDSLAKQTGEQGLKIKLDPITTELDSIVNNKALNFSNPQAVQYAKGFKDRIADMGEFDAPTVQDIIQNFNNTLKAFYRNPSYDNASKAAIDAMIANKMRTSLDETITGLTGTQYGALKRQYGSLSTIERDVVRANLRDARKNIKGLIDFSDIFSGSQVVNGILSMNPAAIAQGAVAKGISAMYKHLNNPNRAIESIFNIAEKVPNAVRREPAVKSVIKSTKSLKDNYENRK